MAVSSRIVPVVCALIEREGEVLLAKRAPGSRLGGLWEFPGGKVEPGETAEAALHRELKEELDCQVRVREALPVVRFAYDWVEIDLSPFVCELTPASPPPRALEHSDLVWVSWKDVAKFELAPADVPVLRLYQAQSC